MEPITRVGGAIGLPTVVNPITIAPIVAPIVAALAPIVSPDIVTIGFYIRARSGTNTAGIHTGSDTAFNILG